MTVPPIVTVTNAGGPATLHSFDSPSEDKTAALYSPDDKASSLPHLSPRSVVSDLPGTPSYTAAEEAAVRLKLDMLLMPLLFFGFYVFSLDRGNIANALSNGFMHDVGIQQDQFNTGQALLNVGIILLEVPSTYVLLWIGPNLWLSLQVFAFGFVSIFQLYQKGVGAYYATRLLLGLTEAGYIPGALYIISSFYRQNELGKRNAFFFLAAGIGSATSGLWAYAIFPLGVSRPQMKGWQWMWLIEGLMTVFVAMVFILLLPASPHDPRSVARISIFSSRERDVLVGRVVAEEAAKKEADRRLNLKEILKTLGNWRIWPHMLIAIAGIALRAVLMLYAPALIQSFRFDTLTANALSSVGGWVSVIMTAVFGILTDKTNLRGPMCITTLALFLVFWIAFQQKSLVDDRWLKFGLIVMVQGFTWAFHPINATWLAVNVRTPQHRAVALAMFVMAANAGAAIGTQLLRQDDAPLYTKGFKGAIGMAAIALGAALAQSVQYTWTNKRLDRRVANQGGEYGAAAGVAGWRYTP